MKKSEEISNPNSCFNKAKDDEVLFVLLERDAAAPAAIREWIRQRIKIGLNKPGDAQIQSAWDTILAMTEEIDDNEEKPNA